MSSVPVPPTSMGSAPAGLRSPSWLARTAPDPLPRTPRPMGVTELLDEAFRILRSEYRTLGPIVAVVATPLAVVSAFATRQAFRGQSGLSSFGVSAFGATGGHGSWVVPLYLIALLWPALVAGPVCRVTAARWFGRVESRRSAWRGGLRRVPALLVAVVVVDLMVAVGALFLFLPAVAVWVLFRLTLPVMVVEGVGPFRGVGRSASVVGRRFWAVLAVSVLGSLTGEVVGQLLSLLPGGAAGLFGLHWGFLILAAGSIAVQTVTWSWSLILITLVYLDNRARGEGLDLVVRSSLGAR